MEDVLVHCPATPVYDQLPPIDGIVHIRAIPDDKPKNTVCGLSRRDKAFIAADAKRGRLNLSAWSVSDLAGIFGASKRTVFEVLRLTEEERLAVLAGHRPLFLHRSSLTSSPRERMRQIVAEVGPGIALDLLAAESEKAEAA
jgi:hypothetical protein